MDGLVLKYPDINAQLALPRIAGIVTEVLPAYWANFCKKYKIILNVVILYENEAETGKLWPASKIAVNGVSRGDHMAADTACDSTSGGYGLAFATVIEMYQKLDPSFPIKRFVAVVPRSLPVGKREGLIAKGIELVDANDSIDAMRVAKALAEEKGYWYTGQYWNQDNSQGYTRIAHFIADSLPDLGLVAWGVGSGGGCSEIMKVLTERFSNRDFRLQRIAVLVEDGQKVGGVRDEGALEPGSLDWRSRLDGARFVGEDPSCTFSSALWRQAAKYPDDTCFGGQSTGFAGEGAMLALREMIIMRRLDEIRAYDGYVYVVIPSLDRRDPYRSEYGKRGIYWD